MPPNPDPRAQVCSEPGMCAPLLHEMRRHNSVVEQELRASNQFMQKLVTQLVYAVEKTDPSVRAARHEINSWPTRVRMGVGTFVVYARKTFERPVANLLMAMLAYYLYRYTQPVPLPTQVQVPSMPDASAPPSALPSLLP